MGDAFFYNSGSPILPLLSGEIVEIRMYHSYDERTQTRLKFDNGRVFWVDTKMLVREVNAMLHWIRMNSTKESPWGIVWVVMCDFCLNKDGLHHKRCWCLSVEDYHHQQSVLSPETYAVLLKLLYQTYSFAQAGMDNPPDLWVLYECK